MLYFLVKDNFPLKFHLYMFSVFLVKTNDDYTTTQGSQLFTERHSFSLGLGYQWFWDSGISFNCLLSVIGVVEQDDSPTDKQLQPNKCIKFLLFTFKVIYNNNLIDSI